MTPAHETPRHRFLRNHQENMGILMASALRAERRGDAEIASRIRAIADEWERWAEEARQQEAAERPSV